MDIKRVRFTLAFQSPGMLPPWKGGTLRGAIGHQLKKLYCLSDPPCRRCKKPFTCPYGYLYEARPPRTAPAMSAYKQIPKPYVIEPPPEENTPHPRGSQLSFHVNLFGNGTRFLPELEAAVASLETIGKGRSQGYGRVTLAAKEYWNSQKEGYQSAPCSVRLRFPERFQKVEIVFHTPLMLVLQDAVVETPSFGQLVRAAARRFSALHLFYGNKKIAWDWKALYAEADAAVCTRSDFEHKKVSRWAGKLKRGQSFPAIQGKAAYHASGGEHLEQAAQALAFGELAHIGKLASFGMGRYSCRFS